MTLTPHTVPAPVLYIHTPRGSLSSADSHEALDFLQLQAGPYLDLTKALVRQAERVRGGGEAWTREEQLAKYARLRKMADDVVHKVAQAKYAKGARPGEGSAAGGGGGAQAAGETSSHGSGGGSSGGACGCGHGGHGHGHEHEQPPSSPAPSPYALTDLDQAVLSAVAAAEKELGLAGEHA